jgi:hypothetical protein
MTETLEAKIARLRFQTVNHGSALGRKLIQRELDAAIAQLHG